METLILWLEWVEFANPKFSEFGRLIMEYNDE